MSRTSGLGLAVVCSLVAILAGVAAAIGILARGADEFITVTSARGEVYEMTTTGVYAFNHQRVVAEGVGWDLVTLVVAVPALLIVAPLVARGSFRGRLVAAGLLGYFLYQYLEYSMTWAFGPLFLLFVAIYATSLLGIAGLAWSLAAEHGDERLGEGFPRRGWAALNLAMSGLLAMMWLMRIAVGLGGEPVELLGETTFTVQALDLGLVIPVSVLSAVLVLRRSAIGYTVMAAYGVTFAVMAAAITAMLLSAWAVEGTLEVVPVGLFGAASVSALALLFRTYRTHPLAVAGRPLTWSPG